MSETPAAPPTRAEPNPSTPPTPPTAPEGSSTGAVEVPAVEPAVAQRLADTEQAAQQATAERDELLAALRKVLDPSGAAGEQDPARLAEQAATERDTALAEAKQLRVELAAHQAAHRGGADPARLLDSRAVEQQLAELDPAEAKFAERLDKVIAAAIEANPLLRADGVLAGPPKGGADFFATPLPQFTAEQFAALPYGKRVELFQSDPDLYRRLSAASE
ncbi:hypothetical protein ACIQU6_05520 [Streptomyces sp. NPDC090442]|uniref:hypothetical protein n=1 Tax=Streptomyces sp. NPDC090442 TaxID=3365962 RepID=UPI00381BCC59